MPGVTALTAKELSKADDLVTSFLVDPYLGFTSHKMSTKRYNLSEDETRKLQTVITDFQITSNHDLAYEKILNMFAKYDTETDYWQATEARKRHLRNHIVRYLNIFDRNAGFRLAPCSQYSRENNVGVKVVATKHWNKNETIPFLLSYMAPLSEEDLSTFIEPGRNDFSIMNCASGSSEKLYLGPGSYLNHACSSNLEYKRSGRNLVTVKVSRSINDGEEMFTYYGPHYFGPDNMNCECDKCQRRNMPPKELLTQPAIILSLRKTGRRHYQPVKCLTLCDPRGRNLTRSSVKLQLRAMSTAEFRVTGIDC